MARQVGDWMRLRCGDRVIADGDARHIGRVERIRTGYDVTVTWEDSGWVTELPLHCLTKVRYHEKKESR